MLTNGRRGAGHVEVPLNVLQQEVEVRSSKFEVNSSESNSGLRTQNAEFQRAAELLAEARGPLILAGGGVIAAEAWVEVVEIAELLQAVVRMSLMGKGVVFAVHLVCGC